MDRSFAERFTGFVTGRSKTQLPETNTPPTIPQAAVEKYAAATHNAALNPAADRVTNSSERARLEQQFPGIAEAASQFEAQKFDKVLDNYSHLKAACAKNPTDQDIRHELAVLNAMYDNLDSKLAAREKAHSTATL